MVLKGPRHLFCGRTLCTLSPDSPCQLNIFRHDGNSPGVDGTQVGIVKQPDKVCLRCFLETQYRCQLESQVCLVVLGDLPHYPLEGQLSDEQCCAGLEVTNVLQSRSPCSVPVKLYQPPCIRASWIFLFCSSVQSSTRWPILVLSLGTRDIEGWQLPVNRRVSCALLTWFLVSPSCFGCSPPPPVFLHLLGSSSSPSPSQPRFLPPEPPAPLVLGPSPPLVPPAPLLQTAGCRLLHGLLPPEPSAPPVAFLSHLHTVCQLQTFLFRGVLVPIDFGIGPAVRAFSGSW